MKKIMLLFALLPLVAIGQQNTEIFTKKSLEKEIRVITAPDTVTSLFRYDFSYVLTVPDTSRISYFKCEYFKNVVTNGISSEITINELNINIKTITPSSYNNLYNQSYFIMGKEIFFRMKELEVLPDTRIKISAFDSNNRLLKKETYSLDF